MKFRVKTRKTGNNCKNIKIKCEKRKKKKGITGMWLRLEIQKKKKKQNKASFPLPPLTLFLMMIKSVVNAIEKILLDNHEWKGRKKVGMEVEGRQGRGGGRGGGNEISSSNKRWNYIIYTRR